MMGGNNGSRKIRREYKSPITDGRSIELDIYAEDKEGKIYDIEVQRADSGADVHRARFHSSMLDTKMLKAKQKFKEIHDSYVIFITENDYMKKGLPLYHVERVVQETQKFRQQQRLQTGNGTRLRRMERTRYSLS